MSSFENPELKYKYIDVQSLIFINRMGVTGFSYDKIRFESELNECGFSNYGFEECVIIKFPSCVKLANYIHQGVER